MQNFKKVLLLAIFIYLCGNICLNAADKLPDDKSNTTTDARHKIGILREVIAVENWFTVPKIEDERSAEQPPSLRDILRTSELAEIFGL